MKMDLEAEITQLMEIKDKETGKINFVIEKNGEWISISKEEYNQLIGENHD